MTAAAEWLEFPCEFFIKAMGLNAEDFADLVARLIGRHVADLEGAKVEQRTSSGGKYLSVTIGFQAQDRPQLEAIYQELSRHPRVLMVL